MTMHGPSTKATKFWKGYSTLGCISCSKEWGLSDSFYKSNTSCEPSYWSHAVFYSGVTTTNSCFPTASRVAHASFSSKLPSIRLILFTLFCVTSHNSPILEQQCIPSTTSQAAVCIHLLLQQ